MKRIMDLIFSVILFIVLVPIFIIISIIIKIDSKGPIIFNQRRIGKNGVEFLIYKFRTMKVDTPNIATDKFSSAQNYITRTGSFLRKTSLDEIPQLINIIRGDMSFVGPRPALYNQYELIKMREEKGINICMPGITGYAQINGRDMVADNEKVKFDEYYAKNQTVYLDIKIVFSTFIKVLLKKDISN